MATSRLWSIHTFRSSLVRNQRMFAPFRKRREAAMRAVAQSGGPRSNQISGTFWLRRSRAYDQISAGEDLPSI